MSPKNAPQQIAPTTIGAGIPIDTPIPRNATPTVPTVVQELPVKVLIIAQRITVKGRIKDGENIFRPAHIT